MRLEITPNEPMQIRIKHNGKVILDEKLEKGVHRVLEPEHPKCGTAEAFIVDGEDEMLIGSATYGDCECEEASHKAE